MKNSDGVAEPSFSLGKTKIFFKEQSTLQYLNRLLDKLIRDAAVKIQTNWRTYRHIKIYERVQGAVRLIQQRTIEFLKRKHGQVTWNRLTNSGETYQTSSYVSINLQTVGLLAALRTT